MVITHGERGDINWDWALGIFLGEGNILYLDLSVAHMAVYKCITIWLHIYAFYVSFI